MIARLAECGFDAHSIMTVDGARSDYEGCYSDYRLALEAGDEARQAELAARYDVMIARLAECGLHSIMTVDGARSDYEETLLDEFAHYWAGSIDGQSHGPYPWYEAYFKEYGGK